MPKESSHVLRQHFCLILKNLFLKRILWSLCSGPIRGVRWGYLNSFVQAVYHTWTLSSIEINSILSKNSSHLNVGGCIWFKEQSKECMWEETARNRDGTGAGQQMGGAWVTGTSSPIVPCRPSRHRLQPKEHTSWVQLRPYWDNLKLSKVLFFFFSIASVKTSLCSSRGIGAAGRLASL